MKTNPWINVAVAAAIGLLSNMQTARATGQEGHGGDAVVTENAIRLRDLMDPGNCTWRAGKSVLAAYPEITPILDQVKNENPELGYGIDKQIKKIRWCFTTALKKIDTNDNGADKLTYYLDPYASKKIQAGVRVLDVVYIDSRTLNKMVVSDSPYFFIHEALHGFIAPDATLRNRKIRDTVNAIKKLVDRRINGDDFDATLSGSEVNVYPGKSSIQALVGLINDESLSKNQIAELADQFPAAHDRSETAFDSLRRQIMQTEQVASVADLTTLGAITGKAKFDLLASILKADSSEDKTRPRMPLVEGFSVGKCIIKPVSSYAQTGLVAQLGLVNSQTTETLAMAGEGSSSTVNVSETHDPILERVFFTPDCDVAPQD